jgi:NitT/TauT family transport system substrate-binding protein
VRRRAALGIHRERRHVFALIAPRRGRGAEESFRAFPNASPVLRRFIVLVAASVALASAALPARADDTLTIIGGASQAGFFDVLDHVAQLGGFYKAEHLDVEKSYTSPPIAAQLVASGKADIYSAAVESAWSGYQHGIRLQFFFSRDPRFSMVLGVLADSPIKTLADFKGATLGTTTAGGPTEGAAASMLAGAGLQRGDYSFLPIGVGAAALSAMLNKRVDGTAFPNVELGLDEVNSGVKFRIFEHPILNTIGDAGFAATPATIAAKSEQLQRFCRALVKAAIVIHVNPRYAARLFLQGAGVKITPDALDKEVRVLALMHDELPGGDPLDKRIGLMPAHDMAVLIRFFAERGLLPAIPTEEVVTDRFIAYANDFDHRAFIAQAKRMR